MSITRRIEKETSDDAKFPKMTIKTINTNI
jgi:hypothetical protein